MKKHTIMENHTMKTMPRNIEECIADSIGSTTSSSQADVDAFRSSNTAGISKQHHNVVSKERRRKKKKMHQRQERVNQQNNEAQSQPSRNNDKNRDIERVGAFPIPGIGQASSVQVPTASINTETRTASNDDSIVFPVLDASAVDEESPVLEGMPIDEFEPTESHHLHSLLKSRKCRIISTLAFALVVGMIVAIVLLTQSGSKAAPTSSPTQTASNLFLAELEPFLSNESLTALDNPDSPQSQSLQWLFERSNFQAWPFHRQVQRFAMATIYYATDGPSWSNAGGNYWLTNATECEWFQGFQGDFCNQNGTLLYLNQSMNALKGTIPNEIGLLSSLTIIDLSDNTPSGTVPSELGYLTALTYLNLHTNFFKGTVPSELGSLTALNVLSLFSNSFAGTLPSELGSLTALIGLLLSSNSFTGTVPSELGSLTALSFVNLASNNFTGTVPAELCNLGTVSIQVDCAPGPQCSCCTCFQP